MRSSSPPSSAGPKRCSPALRRVATILGADDPFHYRNKAIASFAQQGGQAVAGIYAAGTHRVLPLPAAGCLLQAPILDKTIAAAVAAVRAVRWPVYDEDRGTGLVRHLLVRWGHASGQVMVVLVAASDRLPGSRRFVEELRRAAPWVTTVVHNHNPRRTSAVLGRNVRTLYGPGFITDTLCGLTFKLSPGSFYQVNPAQTERLYAQAQAYAGLTGRETVVDAYCGIGTIGLCAAAAGAAQVYGVEQTPAAVQDARANAAHNGIKNAPLCLRRRHALDAPRRCRGSAPPTSSCLNPPPRGQHARVHRRRRRHGPAPRRLRQLRAGYPRARCRPVRPPRLPRPAPSSLSTSSPQTEHLEVACWFAPEKTVR